MKSKEKFLTGLLHRLSIYKKLLLMGVKHLFKKTYYSREKDYFGYIGETKQTHCPHKNISRLSYTKFYCTECGKSFHYVPEEAVLISELLSIFIVGTIVYLLTKSRKE